MLMRSTTRRLSTIQEATTMATKRQGAESARPKGPEGATRRQSEADVEGHATGRRVIKATQPADEPGTGPQTSRPRATEGDDVEGHNFGHNAMLSRNAAQTRERDAQRNARNHELKSEARRPFFKKG
jgi:hypothetical protein